MNVEANDTIKQGDLFVITRGKINKRVIGGGFASFGTPEKVVDMEDTSCDGVVWRVLNVCGNNISADSLFGRTIFSHTQSSAKSFNLLDIEIELVTEEYLDSLLNAVKKETTHGFDKCSMDGTPKFNNLTLATIAGHLEDADSVVEAANSEIERRDMARACESESEVA